ncbi:MAG: hypothetical protein GX970_02775 [Phyllobacteriaceae bacterium]|nr:hypothetical protein [Phyllobacteriaceae bacterium]
MAQLGRAGKRAAKIERLIATHAHLFPAGLTRLNVVSRHNGGRDDCAGDSGKSKNGNAQERSEGFHSVHQKGSWRDLLA